MACHLVRTKTLSKPKQEYVNWSLKNTLQWNLMTFWNSNIFILKNAFEDVVWKMMAILSWPQCINLHNFNAIIQTDDMPAYHADFVVHHFAYNMLLNQTVILPVNWDALTLMRHHCNAKFCVTQRLVDTNETHCILVRCLKILSFEEKATIAKLNVMLASYSSCIIWLTKQQILHCIKFR